MNNIGDYIVTVALLTIGFTAGLNGLVYWTGRNRRLHGAILCAACVLCGAAGIFVASGNLNWG